MRALKTTIYQRMELDMTTLQEITKVFSENNTLVEGKTVKLDFGSAGVILLDGIAMAVSNEDKPANATITVSLEDFMAITQGSLDGMAAFTLGRLKVAGDMGAAMKFQSLSAAIRR